MAQIRQTVRIDKDESPSLVLHPLLKNHEPLIRQSVAKENLLHNLKRSKALVEESFQSPEVVVTEDQMDILRTVLGKSEIQNFPAAQLTETIRRVERFQAESISCEDLEVLTYNAVDVQKHGGNVLERLAAGIHALEGTFRTNITCAATRVGSILHCHLKSKRDYFVMLDTDCNILRPRLDVIKIGGSYLVVTIENRSSGFLFDIIVQDINQLSSKLIRKVFSRFFPSYKPSKWIVHDGKITLDENIVTLYCNLKHECIMYMIKTMNNYYYEMSDRIDNQKLKEAFRELSPRLPDAQIQEMFKKLYWDTLQATNFHLASFGKVQSFHALLKHSQESKCVVQHIYVPDFFDTLPNFYTEKVLLGLPICR